MAQTKEGLVVILDISNKTRASNLKGKQNFFEKQKDCCISLLQNKIFAGKKDEVSFILMGSENTDNELNRNIDGYENIIEGIPMQIPNWNMLTTLVNSMNLEKGSAVVNWLDSIGVALDILRREEAKRFKYLKIVLFHQFLYEEEEDYKFTDEQEFCVTDIISRLKELNIEIVIVCDHVKYRDDSNAITKSVFSNLTNKSSAQIISEKYANKVIEETDGILCNFDIASSRMIRGLKPKGKPAYWYSTLDIGSKIKIHIAVTISIKKEESLTFKTKSVKESTLCYRATEYFENGEKKLTIQDNVKGNTDLVSGALPISQDNLEYVDLAEELIDGYMLGSTPVACEKLEKHTKKGMQCIGFTQRSNVLSQYLIGEGTNLVFGRSTMEVSQKMIAALVEALHKSDLVMIGRRVYNDGNRPKFIALFPNLEHEYPCLSLFGLYTVEQQIHMHFPSLRSKKMEPTEEQYKAIDNLMNAMNLDDNFDGNDELRDEYEKNVLPLNKLINVTNEHISHMATTRIIEELSNIKVSLQERDNIFNVPDKIYKKSIEPLSKIKEQFHLEEIKKEVKKELIQYVGDINSRELDNDIILGEEPLEYKRIISVGTITPAEDFKNLVKREVENIDPVKNDQKIPVFDKLTKQIQEVLKDLIFKTIALQYDKITKSLKMYRDEAAQYNPYDFNDFIKEIKAMAVSRKMYEFWNEVIVKNKLGLLSSKECNFFNATCDGDDVDEFYNIDVEKPVDPNENNDENVDELFDDM